jgi:hypothetical protein
MTFLVYQEFQELSVPPRLHTQIIHSIALEKHSVSVDLGIETIHSSISSNQSSAYFLLAPISCMAARRTPVSSSFWDLS